MNKQTDTVPVMANTLPWNELVLTGQRTFKTFHQNWKHRGTILLYNSHRIDENIDEICEDYYLSADKVKEMPKGVIVGSVEVTGVIHQDESLSGWFEIELANPKRFKNPIPYTPPRGSIRLSKAPKSLLRRKTV
jgi:hypothetical protein